MPLSEFTRELDRLVTKFTRNQAFYTSKDFQESELQVGSSFQTRKVLVLR
jgi:hypothetical protein